MDSILYEQNSYEPPLDILLETWWPMMPDQPSKNPQTLYKYSKNAERQREMEEAYEKTCKNLTARYVGMANSIVARIAAVLEQTGLPTLAEPHKSNFCSLPANMSLVPGKYSFKPTKAYVHLGPNMIELIHKKPSRIMQIKHFKWWPKNWWQPNRLAASIENEVVAMESITKRSKADLKKTQKEYKLLAQDVQLYTQYLGDSRKRMVAIGKKTRHYIEETQYTRSAKVTYHAIIMCL